MKIFKPIFVLTLSLLVLDNFTTVSAHDELLEKLFKWYSNMPTLHVDVLSDQQKDTLEHIGSLIREGKEDQNYLGKFSKDDTEIYKWWKSMPMVNYDLQKIDISNSMNDGKEHGIIHKRTVYMM
ncbi:Hypothetical protein CINCED_3A010601 [Cinara cedri]|uniref:Uncharacterized protein n=1 Tax=Cinara cedri TaxID=506608 RepID=A0A5E4NNR6_9HEMI|nr:Hypothetical protein CINCED_3A010601 [Cinara cedri]